MMVAAMFFFGPVVAPSLPDKLSQVVCTGLDRAHAFPLLEGFFARCPTLR